MIEKGQTASFVNDDKYLNEILQNGDFMLSDDLEPALHRNIVALAYKNNLYTCWIIAGRGDYSNAARIQEEERQRIRQTGDFKKDIVVTENPKIAEEYRQIGANVYQADQYYFLYGDIMG